ncbi:prolyl oligopeptidase family serine peptidase [Flavihumibacter rivuli]|uniref:alpha/beta hydrolase family protein n=1 Tax=Flavihumibacter rivuli TaxID=2838156 RepID=UPI001BDF1A60|nr:prolyl oligopeptidase family serine peptidase [Flavihumibacter rivuli]ULQ58000.1 prolyl oligopeptidase family serine peptidase [Flavihumibacter rivuli]
MRRKFFLAVGLLLASLVNRAQKKPLTHADYDQWQSISERQVSNNGKYAAFVVNPQEGDGELVVRALDGDYSLTLPRGAQPLFSADSRYLVCKIKPFFKDARDARIKKKPSDEMPKDSMAIILLGKDSIIRVAQVKSFKMAEDQGRWLAYHLERTVPVIPKPVSQDSTARLQKMMVMADSLDKAADSLRLKVGEARIKGLSVLQPAKAKEPSRPQEEKVEEGTVLVLYNLETGKEERFPLVSAYEMSKNGKVLAYTVTRKNGTSGSIASVIWRDLGTGKVDTVMRKFNEVRGMALDEAGTQLAFVAERDSVAKALRKYYRLWYYQPAMDSAIMLADWNHQAVKKGWTVSPDHANQFSKDGRRLFFGLAAVPPVKDTSLVDFETAKLDVWNYKDDYLQPQQLVQVNNELKRSFLAMVSLEDRRIMPLADEAIEDIMLSDEGNGRYAMGAGSKPYRVQQQWELSGLVDLYLLDLVTGQRSKVAGKVRRGSAAISPLGRFTYWYDYDKRMWMGHDNEARQVKNLTSAIKVPLFDEEDDHPDAPPPHGMMGWHEGDRYLYVYDKYDIWRLDPAGKEQPLNITAGAGRKASITIRYNRTHKDDRYVRDGQKVLLNLFDNKEKGYGWEVYTIGTSFNLAAGKPMLQQAIVNAPLRSRDEAILVYNRETPASRNIYASRLDAIADFSAARQLSNINTQQGQYNWFTVELLRWKMFDGKMSEGLLYKPENFDPNKKYPVILYFYERNADTRYNYIEPMPVRASVNIAFYCSNGYIVFDPNIYYKTGQPGEDAYNSVVSAAKHLTRFKWVDSTRMGIQGHSWGGYQVSYLITRTNMFAAAEAGAPVANMTSAYGGIRWGTGLSRQFQYERSQSRLGATLWEKPELYLKNSPLFRADKVKTPLLMLHNDKDDAVPWYQGIEYFTALRRLGKPVWMINYNDELHGIRERRNRKDWTIRMAQFFDHYLKGAPAPKWMTEGVPATRKGIDWGLDLEKMK